MSHHPRRAPNPLHAVLAVAAVALVALTLYNYTRSGRVGWGSIGVAVLLLFLVALQRGGRPKRGDGPGRT